MKSILLAITLLTVSCKPYTPAPPAPTPVPVPAPAPTPVPIPIPVPVPPPPDPTHGLAVVACPYDAAVGYGTVGDWHQIALKAVQQLHLTRMEPTQLEQFRQAMKAVHPFAEMQHNSANELKPRLFLPTAVQTDSGACGIYARPVDFGDFGMPFFTSSNGTGDQWIPTGRFLYSAW